MIEKPSDKDVGKKVKKENGKPFPNGKKVGEVIELTFNPSSGRPAYKIKNQKVGYMVQCHECEFVK